MIRVLHTSDWHLGASLHDEKRTNEFQRWLDWLRQAIVDHHIDVLLVAGDVFDVANPSIDARKMYYNFLANISKDGQCKNVIITAGNHDSAALLEAPKEILATLQTRVIGQACKSIQDEVISVSIHGDDPDLIVCAVPFLPSRDVCKSLPGETPEAHVNHYRDGVANHYAEVAKYATQLRNKSARHIPIIAMGHLYVAGATVTDTQLQVVGNLNGMSADIFGSSFDYIALGHIHKPQIVDDNPFIRYCGAPIPISFSECQDTKTACIISFDDSNHTPQIETIEIPCFQKMKSIEATSLDEIKEKLAFCIEESSTSGESIWVQVNCKSDKFIPSLSDTIKEMLKDTKVNCLRVTNRALVNAYLRNENNHAEVSLNELTPEDVFNRLLNAMQVGDDKTNAYRLAFKTILEELANQGINP